MGLTFNLILIWKALELKSQASILRKREFRRASTTLVRWIFGDLFFKDDFWKIRGFKKWHFSSKVGFILFFFWKMKGSPMKIWCYLVWVTMTSPFLFFFSLNSSFFCLNGASDGSHFPWERLPYWIHSFGFRGKAHLWIFFFIAPDLILEAPWKRHNESRRLS